VHGKVREYPVSPHGEIQELHGQACSIYELKFGL
jgi:hypothetical protein